MKVNKKRLAEIFNVDPRTIERWQSQGLPCASKGSKGIESVFDTAMAIQWYAQRETDIENEKLRKELDDLRAAAESDLQPGTIDYERYRLTKAQTEAQQLVAEELVEKWEKGKMRLLWDNKKRRNEALDCLVYAYAALRVSVQRWQLDLAVLAKSREEETTRPTLKELAAKLSGGVNGYSR